MFLLSTPGKKALSTNMLLLPETKMETQFKINSDYYFDVLMENHSSKIASNTMVAATVLIFTPLYYFIVWYERSGHNNRRTLINQVLTFHLGDCSKKLYRFQVENNFCKEETV